MSMKYIFFSLNCWLFILLVPAQLFAQTTSQTEFEKTGYHPRYWIQGRFDFRNNDAGADVNNLVASLQKQGWGGILYWGADRREDKMLYYFKSPFLETQDWAIAGKDNLSALTAAAHKKEMKVMINIEGVDPYHWKQNHWTPENIQAVANDLAASNVDAVFEECFDVKPYVFLSLAKTLKNKGVDYVSGTDPMLFRESNFTALWPRTGIIDIYNYYLKRNKIFNIATLAQNGTLGYGWAKYWNMPTSMTSPLSKDWGISTEDAPAVVSYITMIRALQYRIDNYIIIGDQKLFDPIANQQWINSYVDKQKSSRPVMDIVVLLKNEIKSTEDKSGDPGWERLFNSGDAITSGAFNAGYDVIVSDKVVPADAYWIYASGGSDDMLPSEVVALFNSDKPVFIQCGSGIPSGSNITAGWKTVLEKCGIDGSKSFSYGGGAKGYSGSSLPPSQKEEIPYTGYYKNIYLRFTGTDNQRGKDLRAGTIIPGDAISSNIYCEPNNTYGKGPFILGKNKKYVVTPTCLNWEVNYPISDLLSGNGVLPSSNVWGIVGKDVTALLAIEATQLDMTIPGLPDGSKIHVVVWDKLKNKKSDETVIYHAPYRHWLNEYDFILIDAIK